MGRRVDIEPDHRFKLVGEFGVVGELEGPHPMRLQKPLPGPDPAHREGLIATALAIAVRSNRVA